MTTFLSCHASHVHRANSGGYERWYFDSNLHRWGSYVPFVNAKGETNENRYRVHDRGSRLGVLPFGLACCKDWYESARGVVAHFCSRLGGYSALALGGKEILEGGRVC